MGVCPDAVGKGQEFARFTALFASAPLRQQLLVKGVNADLLFQLRDIDHVFLRMK